MQQAVESGSEAVKDLAFPLVAQKVVRNRVPRAFHGEPAALHVDLDTLQKLHVPFGVAPVTTCIAGSRQHRRIPVPQNVGTYAEAFRYLANAVHAHPPLLTSSTTGTCCSANSVRMLLMM